MNGKFDKAFEIRNRIYAFLKRNLISLESKIQPINKFWNIPNKEDSLYFTKSRALDIIYSNNNNLLFVTNKFPDLEDKELNYEFNLNETDVGFSIDLKTLLDCIKEILYYYNKENFLEVEKQFTNYNRYLNKQKSNYDNFKNIITNKLAIHNNEDILREEIYKDYEFYHKDLEIILDTFSLYSYLLLELFELENSINRSLREYSKVLTFTNK